MQSDRHFSFAIRYYEFCCVAAILLVVLLGVPGPLVAQTYAPSKVFQKGSTQPTAVTGTPVPILNELAKLLASDGAADDSFGVSVSVSGDVAVVGARLHDDNGDSSGSAYVFRWSGSAWIEEQELLASDGAADDFFGWSVSVSGDVAVVGAIGNDDTGSFSGSAYVFRWNGSTWVEEQKLLSSDIAAGDGFGGAVSIFGDVAIVGAVGAANGGQNSGAAYVFIWNGSAWVQEAKLLASDPQESRRFATSLSVHGDVAVIGAFSSDENGLGSGSAYVFRRDGSTWVREQKLLASDGAEHDLFGRSVSVSGVSIVVGAPGDDIPFGEEPFLGRSGSAYVFRWNGAAWIEVKKLLPSDGRDGDFFGMSVGISGGVIVFGASSSGSVVSNTSIDDTGAAYVFRWNGTAWAQERKLLASDRARNDQLGGAVGVSGDLAVVGARFDDVNGENTGSAYVFEIEEPDTNCDVNGADEIANCNGDAACGDCDLNGVPDRCQFDADGDGLINECDACPGDPLKTEVGQCGCGVPDTDSNGDNIPDCVVFFPIPTVSEWGLALLTLLLLVMAKLRFGWVRRHAT